MKIDINQYRILLKKFDFILKNESGEYSLNNFHVNIVVSRLMTCRLCRCGNGWMGC